MVASGLPTAYASGLAIPQPSQSVDIVLLLDVIEHVYEHDQLLKEIARVLRPGGMLLLTTPILGAKLVPWIDMHKVHLGWDHHYREGYTFEEITTLAAAQGFQIVEYSTAFNFLSRWAYYAHFFMRGGRRLLAPRPALFALITHLEPLLPLAGLTHVFVLRSIETRCS
jgi:SAM-dependent methyltransferase